VIEQRRVDATARSGEATQGLIAVIDQYCTTAKLEPMRLVITPRHVTIWRGAGPDPVPEEPAQGEPPDEEDEPEEEAA